MLVGLQLCVQYRQKHRRAFFGLTEPPKGIIFPKIAPDQFDHSLKNCLKSVFNYGFYKFGLEVFFFLTLCLFFIFQTSHTK